MIDEYLADASIEFVDEIVILNPIILYKFFKAKNSYELSEKVHNYLIKNKDYFKNYIGPKKYMYSYKVSDKVYVNEMKLNFIDDVNLLIYVFSKTVGNLYIPKRSMNVNNRSFEKVLFFNKKEFYGE